MKQKTINQNKLQTLLCIIALTLGVLVSAVLFSMPPVHAEEITVTPLTMVVTTEIDDSWNDRYGTITYTIENNIDLNFYDVCAYYDTGKAYGTDIDTRTISFIWKRKSDNVISFSNGSVKIINVDATGSTVPQYSLNSTTQTLTLDQSRYDDGTNKGFYSYYTFVSGNYPIAESYKDAQNYLLYGDKSGLVPSEVPDTSDELYTFTGFTMNSKIARWTGTTERSYAKEVDVDEYVKISYAWATTTEPDNLGELQSYDGEFPTSDKQLTLPWSEMESGKTDFQFIRQIKIFPCYRVPHLAYYIGQPVTIYYNTDGSIDKISNPNTPGVLDDSIPIPVLSVNNDKGTFLFANAQNNYKFELKGRFWSTDDFYVFRKMPSLVWQYKYLTLLKNSLTTWVSVGDNMSTLSTYSFGDLGKESWNDLLNTYPIENRNIITGEQQGWLSWANITGYNDAITTLKTLLSTPYSLFNGYEVYVRYYVVCDDGSIKYSKWTHYFNNLADADGSTGSIVDDASNMNNGSQSDKGLTDSDMDNVENSGNSRNDVDAKPSNDFSVEISDITGLFNQFINILKSLYSGMGQLPSLVNAIFGFLPSWASTMIGISLVVIIILRIIGR